MKKFIILAFLVTVFTSYSFSANYETYTGLTYNHGIFLENDDYSKSIFTNGINFSMTTYFLPSNWGFYINGNGNLGYSMKYTGNDVSFEYTSSDWSMNVILSAIIGPSFKYDINDKFHVFVSGGLHLSETMFNSEKMADILNFSFGLGGDLGFRFKPTKKFYLTAGTFITHDFFQFRTTTLSFREEKTRGYYNFTSFKPYIGIGFIR